MTYFQAECIKQDFFVSMEFAEILGKNKYEAYTDVAKKYSPETLLEALAVLLEQRESEIAFIKSVFELAVTLKEAEIGV